MRVLRERSIARGVARWAHVEGGEAPGRRRSGEAVSCVRYGGAHHQACHVGDGHGVAWWDTQRRRSHDGGGANKEATRTETVSLKQGSQFVIENATFVYDDYLISRHQMNCCTNLFVEVNVKQQQWIWANVLCV